MTITTLQHSQCGTGTLNHNGITTCTTCGTEDVPTLHEITAMLHADEHLRVTDGVLQVVSR